MKTLFVIFAIAALLTVAGIVTASLSSEKETSQDTCSAGNCPNVNSGECTASNNCGQASCGATTGGGCGGGCSGR